MYYYKILFFNIQNNNHEIKIFINFIWGGQILFCLLCFNLNTLNSQGEILITGKSQFRNYSFEVKNHCFEIHNFYGTSFPLTPASADYCSASCITTYYDYLAVSNNQNSSDNNIAVIPTSENDLDDYQNGITSNDIQEIYRHDQGIAYITDPFKMVAADVNLDYVIDSADGEMIHDLILEDILFTRNSWEWFNSQDIYDNWGSFTSDPYSWALSENGGSIPFLNVSTSLLSSSTTQPRYFYYNTTKVGDLDTTSNSKNDWVCGTYSFKPKQDKIYFFNKGSNFKFKSLQENTEIELNVTLTQTDTLSYFEIPLLINYDFLELLDVELNDKFKIEYKVHHAKNKFVALFVSKRQSERKVCSGDESLLKIKMRATREIQDLSQLLSINPKRHLDAGNSRNENVNLIVSVVTEEKIKSDLLITFSNSQIFLNQSEALQTEIRILNLMGQVLFTYNTTLNPGTNNLYNPNIGGKFPIILVVTNKSGTFTSVQY